MFQMQSLYPEELVAPMRAELSEAGVEELKTVEDVGQVFFRDANAAVPDLNE